MTPKQWLTLSDGSILTRQEQFVLRQVAAGEIADLKQEFGEAEEDRRLRERFLEELLTGELQGVEVHRRGVVVCNAVVEESLDLENVEVAVRVELLGCIFKKGVNFKDAAFEDHLELNDSDFAKMAIFHRLKVAGNLFCQDTTFAGLVDFVGADIKEHFSAKGAKFLSGDGKANFNGMQVGHDAVFKCCDFKGPVDFSLIQIAGSFHVGPDEKDVLLKKATNFRSSVNFGGARIGVQFGAQRVRFLAENQKANFNGMRVGRSAFFDNAEFHGQVDFINAIIRGLFVANGAKFLSKNFKANFAGMQVGQDARFDESEFHGPVDFVVTDIKRQFVAVGAKFLASNHKVDFYRMQVGQDAFLKGCDFHGVVRFVLIKVVGDLHLEPLLKTGVELSTIFRSGVNFHGADIGGEFLADKVQFLGHSGVSFNVMSVEQDFSARGAVFAGPVNFASMQVKNDFRIDPSGIIRPSKTLFERSANFSRVKVDGVFNADQAIFKSESTIFSGLKVGQGAFFDGTIFFGGLVLKEGQLTDLVISGLHRLSQGGLPIEEIVLNRTKIAHRLTIENIEVKRFDARNLEVKGPAELRRLVIKGEADFRDAAFHHLKVAEVAWLDPLQVQKKTEIYLDGMSYENITTKTNPAEAEKWPELLAWLGLSRFNTQNYGQLDAFFQRCGLKNRADEVYIAGKRREKRSNLHELKNLAWFNPARWLLWFTLWLARFFWGWLAGYGRKPARIFWPSLALVLLGWAIYTPICLEPHHWQAGFQQSHPLWTGLFVSLDRFLPGVDLGVAKVYQPGNLSVFVWGFWHFQKIMGWILGPILLGSYLNRLK